MKDRLQAFAAPILLLALTVGVFWKLTLTRQYTFLESPDLAFQVSPWFDFQAREWHAGRFPLWDPHQWMGQPLLGQAQPGAAYPLNWLLFLLPLNDGAVRQGYLHWYFVLIHYMGALFAYLLARDRGCRRSAAVLGGAAFGLCGYMGSNDWPQMLNGVVWAPLVILFLLRALEGRNPIRNAGIAGGMLGISLLSGHHQAPVFLGIACAGMFFYAFLFQPDRRRKLIPAAALFALLAVFTGGLQTVPALEYARHAKRWVGAKEPVGWQQAVPYYVHQNFSIGPMSLPGAVIPGINEHTDAYIGILTCSLGILGLFAAARRPGTGWLLFLVAAGWLLALARHSIFHGVAYALFPMAEKARNASAAIYLFHLGISMLAAVGADLLLRRSPEAVRLIPPAARWLLRTGAFLASVYVIIRLAKYTSAYEYDRALISAAGALVLAGLLTAWRRADLEAPVFATGLCALLLLDIGMFTAFAYPHPEQFPSIYRRPAEHTDFIAFLRSKGPFIRVEADSELVPYNLGDLTGIDNHGGYLASITSDLLRIPMNAKGHEMLGVRYSIRRKPDRPGQVEVFSAASGAKVFENPAPMPRAWIVHQAVSQASVPDPGAWLDRPDFAPRSEALVSGNVPQLQLCQADESAEITSRSSAVLSLTVRAGCRGLLVVSETFYPGWTVTIDGRDAPILQADVALRGVVVEGGAHQVRFVYRPASASIGAVMSLIGALLLAALFRLPAG